MILVLKIKRTEKLRITLFTNELYKSDYFDGNIVFFMKLSCLIRMMQQFSISTSF